MVKIISGLFDHMVLQRNSFDVCDVKVEGVSSHEGNIFVSVSKNGRTISGFAKRECGKSSNGFCEFRIKGVPVGGPYDFCIEISDSREKLFVRDVLVGDVWLLGGQSNMKGCGNLVDAVKPEPMVRAFYMNDEWRVARDPIHALCEAVDPVHKILSGGYRPPRDTVKGAGPGVGFGQVMHKMTSVPQGLISCAHGGTSMSQWNPESKNPDGSSLYGAMLRRFRRNGSSIAGLLWYQGCSDADPGSAPFYTEKMKRLISELRNDTGNAKLPVVAVQISRVVGNPISSYGFWNSIQDQQRLLPKHIKNLSIVPAIDLTLDDGIHISGRDQDRLACRLARAMQVLRCGKKEGKEAIKLGKISILPKEESVVVEFENIKGCLVSGGRPAGFYLVEPKTGDADFIYDIVLKNNSAILKTKLPVADIQNYKLYYGYGTNPYCNITDGADRSLPVFGPISIGKPRALTEFVRYFRTSPVLAGAGKLHSLKAECAGRVKFKETSFPDKFASRRPELSVVGEEDGLIYYRCAINLHEKMKLKGLIGYDGPVKVWIDGKLVFFDPNGTNPALADEGSFNVNGARGKHEILVAFGANQGMAWGIFLRFERKDVSFADIKANKVVLPILK